MADPIAWHGDPELKARIVARMKQHREADDFIQGVYQRIDPKTALGYRGCAIGCLLDKQPMHPARLCEVDECRYCADAEDNEPEGGWHNAVEQQFGIPADVAHAIDDCFESTPEPHHATFAVESIEAIPVGADLTAIASRHLREGDDWCDDPSKLIELLKAAPVGGAVSR